LIVQDPLPKVQTRIVPLDVPPQAASLVATASERGTALHKAMRVLLLRPDLRLRLSAATGFDEATLDVLQAQADVLKQWLIVEGYTQIECEVPIQRREASGAEFNGIIDLLARGEGKRLILDHKSGAGSFAGYFAQLDAYRSVFAEQVQEIIPDVAIHWIDRAELEFSR
jgi:ATP-dependent exoDNAse (exonuclease V) beta subunit